MAIALKTITRNVVTPVTIVTFVVSTVTGIMLLGHWNAGLVRFSHEWLSVVFSAVGLWHLAKNWNAFVGYLKRNAAIAAFAVSLLASLVVTGNNSMVQRTCASPRPFPAATTSGRTCFCSNPATPASARAASRRSPAFTV